MAGGGWSGQNSDFSWLQGPISLAVVGIGLCMWHMPVILSIIVTNTLIIQVITN